MVPLKLRTLTLQDLTLNLTLGSQTVNSHTDSHLCQCVRGTDLSSSQGEKLFEFTFKQVM